MSDLRIQPLPPETLAAQRPAIDPARAAGVSAAATPAVAASGQGNAGGGGSGTGSGAPGGETPRDQYISPFITIDPSSGLVITQYRNSETGQLQKQYPSEKAVREYRNLQPAAVTVSGGRGAAASPDARSDAVPATEGAGPGRAAASATPVGQPPVGQAPVGLAQVGLAPAQPATSPPPTPQPAAAAPTGGLDKGSA